MIAQGLGRPDEGSGLEETVGSSTRQLLEAVYAPSKPLESELRAGTRKG